MKNIHLLILLSAFIIVSCNDDFLEKIPIESQTEATAFRTYANFETFSWSLYSVFTDTDNFVQGISRDFGNYEGDFLAGYLALRNNGEDNRFRNQNAQTPSSGGGWNFSRIRTVNLMLDNIDGSEMNEKDKNHWRSVGYFFHSYVYMELISRFGDVQWVDKVINEEDTDLIFGDRMPRKEVADKVLERLQFAENNIKGEGDGSNTINTNVVRALMSRFCLFEGTWRKYHNLGDAEKYLNESIRVSKELMNVFPYVDSNYDDLMNSENLADYTGMILFKEYGTDIILNQQGHYERTSQGKYEMHKATVEMYLCADGQTISNSSLYAGDKSMYDEFRNRDRRLLLQVTPPYFRQEGLFEDFTPNGQSNSTNFNGNDNVNEYVDLLEQILPDDDSKRLPFFNWTGTMNWMSPNVLGPGQPPGSSRSGYYMWRNYNLWDTNSNLAPLNTADKPIFHIAEVMLNYAEAMFETGMFNQAVADETINQLRFRAGVANMNISEINASFDPNSDVTVDPVLWEIRRERMVELMGEGFGFQDIRRWKKGEWYINRAQLGVYIDKSNYLNNAGEIVPAWNSMRVVDRNNNPTTSEGYLQRFPNPVNEGRGWKDQYYLFPIPLNDLSLNENLTQNPGWN